jgi:hypothetical protein
VHRGQAIRCGKTWTSGPLRPDEAESPLKLFGFGLIGNARVVRYLAQHHREILAEFQ